MFSADDHSYLDFSGLSKIPLKKRRVKLYKKMSGKDAKLPEVYRKIMLEYGFDEKDVIRHDHEKPEREDCLYFSELKLRSSTKKIESACAREYTEFIEDSRYFDKKTSYLISFIPWRCKGHICDVALEQEIFGISGSHVFMETMAPYASREELYLIGKGVLYRKDFSGSKEGMKKWQRKQETE